MKLRFTRRDGSHVIEDVRGLLVTDDHGNPVISAITQGQSSVWVVSADDPAFDSMVASLGVNLNIQRVLVN